MNIVQKSHSVITTLFFVSLFTSPGVVIAQNTEAMDKSASESKGAPVVTPTSETSSASSSSASSSSASSSSAASSSAASSGTAPTNIGESNPAPGAATPPTPAAAAVPAATDTVKTEIKKTVKDEINEIDADRSRVISIMAQGRELITPLPQLQQQVQLLERLVGRSNPGVVALYNIITTFHYRRAFANGNYADAAKMCQWMLNTEDAAKNTIDDFFAAHTQIQLADLYRQMGKYKESIALLERSLPVLRRGNRAAQKLVKDFKTMESPRDREMRSTSRQTVKAEMAKKKPYFDVLDKQLASTRYEATELGDFYFVMASDYAKSDNEQKAAEYLALAKAKGLSMASKDRSFQNAPKATGKTPGKAHR